MTKAARRLCLLLLLMATLSSSAQAQSQTTSATDGYTPKAIEPGSPAGSYALSGFDTINPYNGGLNFRLPLLKIAGRGGAGYTIQLPIETRWRVLYTHEEFEGQSWDIWDADYNWWRGIDPGYGPGVMLGRQTGTSLRYCSIYDGYLYSKTLTRLTFTAADGTEYEFRDQTTGGQPANVGLCPGSGYSRGTVFITADGSAATFTSDSSINDTNFPGDNVFFPSGYLMFRDGTRYRVDDGVVTEIRDRNGNKATFTYDLYSRVSTIKDSLNRQVTIEYDVTDGVYGLCDRITYKGFNKTARVIRVSKKYLQDILRSGQTLKTMSQLWPELNNASPYTYHNPLLVSDVWLPDGQRKYSLLYNSYSELARVVLPTGGVYEYDWANGVTSGPASGVIEQDTAEAAIYRRVIEKRTYAGGTLENTMTISRPESTTTTSLGFVDMVQTGIGGAYSKTRHYFEGKPGLSLTLGSIDPTGSPWWKEGKEYKTEILNTDGTTVLRREEKNWQLRDPSAGGGVGSDPRVVENVTTLVDTNQVAKRSAINPSTGAVGFDQFNNPTDVWEYDYGAGAAGGLVRRTHTDYLTTNPINNVNYTAANIHIRSLPTQQQVFDAGGTERARTTFEYDNYTTDANHASLISRTSISGLDTAFSTSYTTRGNGTATTHYLLVNGTVSGSITAFAQFDVAGNTTRVIDARGFVTDVGFSDCFGAPDGNAHINTAPTELSAVAQVSYAFPTSVTNSLNQTAYAQFDYHLGTPVDGEDVNGVVASGYFNDALDRPTQIRRAAGTTVTNQSSFSYDDVNRIITTTSDLNNNNDNLLVSKVLYDSLGRTTESRQYEGGTNYIVTQQQYDGLGRVFKTSNPFRPWQSESAVWTTTAFDALGRVTSVTTPDNAVVSTSYSGNQVTVTDQAGKKRKSETDALRRLTSVWEDPTGVNYQSSYQYDVLDNLTTVTQGVQTRSFAHDSLSRLSSAINPESGTTTYGYDNNGNLTSRLDARGITTTFVYDALNRLTSKSYNDNPQTPPINYFYDSQSLPSGAPAYDRGYSTGRLVAVTFGSGSSEGTYRGYDQLGRVVRQHQRTNSVNYLVEASYFANGALQNETYPSVPGAADRRVVSHTNDAAGRLATLSSSATSYAPGATLSAIGYSPHNGLTTETFGSGLVHAITYNNRLQTNQVKLGPSGAPTSLLSIVYNYGTTNNNGNVQSMTYNGGGLTYTQSFGYDVLNRLTTSVENGGASWSQTNGYDRYGNRWIDLGGGNQSLYFNTSNNRITGWTYDSAGNLLNDGVHAYTYDGENKVSKVDGVAAYVYDGEGQRVRKLVGENLRFVYGIAGQLVAEFDGATGNLKKEYIYGNSGLVSTIEPTAMNSNGTRYMVSDHLGTPRVVTNASAGVVSRHDYMPFGEELGSGVGGRTVGMGFGIADGTRQKFTQKERDIETGLDYFEARYYASTQGRFTSPDEFTGGPEELYHFADDASVNPTFYSDLRRPQSLNKYQYAYNNPLRWIDPDGHEPDDDPQKKKKEDIDVVVIKTVDPKIISFDVKLIDKVPNTGEVPVGGEFEIKYKYVINEPTDNSKPEDAGSIAPITPKGTFTESNQVGLVNSTVKVDREKEAVVVEKTERYVVNERRESKPGATAAINYKVVVKDPNTGKVVERRSTEGRGNKYIPVRNVPKDPRKNRN